MTTPAKHALAGRLRIHYQDTGDGPPLLVLNGWTASGLVWPRRWVAALERDFRVLRVCNRGTGYSSPVEEPFHLEDLAADALAVLDAEGVERAHVFGLSMGGYIAQELAIAHPQRLDRMVLAASGPPRPAFVEVRPEVQARLFGSREGVTFEEFLRSQWDNLVAPGFADRDPEVLDRLTADVLAAPTPIPVIMLQWQALQAHAGADRLAAVTTPTLVLHGRDDPLLAVENGRRLHRLIAGSEYEELAGVGHLIPWEAPARTAALVREFLLAGG